MSLRLAVATEDFGTSLKHSIDKAASCHVQGVRLNTRTELNVLNTTASAIRQMLLYVKERRLKAAGLICPIRHPIYDQQHLELRLDVIRRSMSLIRQLETEELLVRCGPIPDPDVESQESSIEQHIDDQANPFSFATNVTQKSPAADFSLMCEVLNDLAQHGNHVGCTLNLQLTNYDHRLVNTGIDVTGPIRLLTNLRQFGIQMNPVSYFYCFDSSGTYVEAVVAEVNNTPWGEQHCYVIPQPQRRDTQTPLRVTNRKQFHVSPFMPMNMDYEWHLSTPGPSLNVNIRNRWQPSGPDQESSHQRRPPFDVTMSVKRTPITRWSMASILVRQPLITVKVFAAIYWQALRLWWKGVKFVPHPNKVAETGNSRRTHPVEHIVIPSQSSDQV